MAKLQSKVAVVTGGNCGIGLAIARRFADEGAHVYIMGHRQVEIDNAVAVIGTVTGVPGDVQDLGDTERLSHKRRLEKGKIDILVAGAGFIDPLAKITDNNLEKIWAILHGTEHFGFDAKGRLNRPDLVDRCGHGNPKLHHLQRQQPCARRSDLDRRAQRVRDPHQHNQPRTG
jgi:NAD(P)-dependent dehydrogenase (short-subunit alcohol dehydrogenase family)